MSTLALSTGLGQMTRDRRRNVMRAGVARGLIASVGKLTRGLATLHHFLGIRVERVVDNPFGGILPFSIEAFIEMHAGPSRQLSLRLN